MLNNSPFYTAGFKDYLDIIFRRKAPYIISFIAAIGIFMILESFQSDKYVSDALVSIQEKSKSSPLLNGFAGSSNFSSRWPVVMSMVFNDQFISEHLMYFSGVRDYTGTLIDGTKDKPHVDDWSRYTMIRRVPYDLYNDQIVKLTPYQWWKAAKEMRRQGIPFSLKVERTIEEKTEDYIKKLAKQQLGSKELQTETSIIDRARQAKWFAKNVFLPIENGRGVPRNLKDEPIMVYKDEEGNDERIIGQKIPVGLKIKDSRLIVKLKEKFEIEVDGTLSGEVKLGEFLEQTTLTTEEADRILNDKRESLRNAIKETVQKAETRTGFNVAFEHDSRRMTPMIVSWTVEMIMRNSTLNQYDLIDSTSEVLKNQLKKSLKKFQELEAEYMERQKKYADTYITPLATGIAKTSNNAPTMPPSFLNTSPQAFVRQSFNEVHQAIHKNEVRLKQIEKEIEKTNIHLSLEQPLISKSQKVKRNEDFDRFTAELLDLQAKRRIELYKKTPLHPHIVELDRKIDSTKAILDSISEFADDEVEKVPNPAYEVIKKQIADLELEKVSTEVNLEELRKQRTELEKTLKEIPEIQQELDNLASGVQDHQTIVRNLQSSLNEVKREHELAYSLSSVDYRLKDYPRFPDAPKSKKFINGSIALVLFFAMSIGLIFVYEFTDPSIKELNDVNRYLDASVLGIIPILEMENENFEQVIRQNPEKFMGD